MAILATNLRENLDEVYSRHFHSKNGGAIDRTGVEVAPETWRATLWRLALSYLAESQEAR